MLHWLREDWRNRSKELNDLLEEIEAFISRLNKLQYYHALKDNKEPNNMEKEDVQA